MAIDSDPAATRLVRAILSDVVRYGGPNLSTDADPRSALAEEIVEGRELFHRRVVPELHSIFERELAAFDFSKAGKQRQSSIGRLLWVGVAIAAMLAGYLLWLLKGSG